MMASRFTIGWRATDHRSFSSTALPTAARLGTKWATSMHLKPKLPPFLIDSRGHGQSDKPHDPSAYTPSRFASDIVAVLDDLGTKSAGYWGYSHGRKDSVCLGAARTRSKFASFVIGGASATSASAYPTEPGKEDPLITALRGGPDAIIEIFGEWVTPQFANAF